MCSKENFTAKTFLMCDFRVKEFEALQVTAILVASIYKYICDRRHGHPPSQDMVRVLDKYVDDVCSGVLDPNLKYNIKVARIGNRA